MVFEETCYKYVYVFSWYLPSLLLCLHVFALFSQSMHPYFQPFSSNYLKGDDFITSLRKTQFQLLSLTDSFTTNHNQNARTEARRNTEDSTRNCAPRLDYHFYKAAPIGSTIHARKYFTYRYSRIKMRITVNK